MAKVFVSHAGEDRPAAREIAAAFAKAGLEPWVDERELRTGDEILQMIAEALAQAEYFAVVLSRTSLNKPWDTAGAPRGRPHRAYSSRAQCERRRRSTDHHEVDRLRLPAGGG
jgi:hypothetical protein